mmetsp:Transcript_58006/g.173120  ORF Transcript_58006/g.173120 Transcript_58006/m.173120 type:complete len:102 (-) Transcript_58006:211-516(-)
MEKGNEDFEYRPLIFCTHCHRIDGKDISQLPPTMPLLLGTCTKRKEQDPSHHCCYLAQTSLEPPVLGLVVLLYRKHYSSSLACIGVEIVLKGEGGTNMYVQ